MLTKNEKYDVILNGKLITDPNQRTQPFSFEGDMVIKTKKQQVKMKGIIYTDPRLPKKGVYDITIKGILYEKSFVQEYKRNMYNVYIDGKMTVKRDMGMMKDYRVNIDGQMEI